MKLAHHKDSWFLTLIGRILPPVRYAVVTIGDTVYSPDGHTPSPSTIAHETVHVEQWARMGLWFPIVYFLGGLPVFLAYGRWRLEREAYLVQIKHHGMTIDEAVKALWSPLYWWCWPPKLMRAWFEAH